MAKQFFLLLFILLYGPRLCAQNEIDTTGKDIQKMASLIQENDSLAIRIQLDNRMAEKLWSVLESPNAFQFSFDSLQSIRKVQSPDGRFKLFTWQLALNEEHYVQRGILQYKTSDGKLQLSKLNDVGDSLDDSGNIISSPKNWIGAVYYDIIQTEMEGKPYYTLLGFDAINKHVTIKLIEVLHFENDQPIFGGDFFMYPPDITYPEAPIKRFIYSYKKGSNALVRYDKEVNAIVLSELDSIANDLNEKSTLVPTGNEVYFFWKDGKWRMPKK